MQRAGSMMWQANAPGAMGHERAFAYAVAVSAALHAVLLGAVPGWKPTGPMRPLGPISARLLALPEPPQAPSTDKSGPEAVLPATAPPPPVTAVAKPVPPEPKPAPLPPTPSPPVPKPAPPPPKPAPPPKAAPRPVPKPVPPLPLKSARNPKPTAERPQPRPDPRAPEAPRPEAAAVPPKPAPAAPVSAGTAAPATGEPAVGRDTLQPTAGQRAAAGRSDGAREASATDGDRVASIAPGARDAAEPAAVDPGLLELYRASLIGAARRYKRYPRAAMDNNWEGTAQVRLVIGANGMIASLSIRNSSGHEILDKQALDMIRKAKPLAPLPTTLRGRPFTVDIPVIFSLKDDKSSAVRAGYVVAACGAKATTWSMSSRIPMRSPTA